ncbi:hypothetical protein Tco_0332607 [Tanacetum coccineum]
MQQSKRLNEFHIEFDKCFNRHLVLFHECDSSSNRMSKSYENIDYVDASPPDAEIVSLEVVEIVIPEVEGIDTDILLTIKDDILHEKLLNSSSTSLNLFLEDTNTFDNSLTESFCFDLEEIEEKVFADELTHIISPSEYDHFCFKIEPELGNLTMDVVEDISKQSEPRFIVHNVFIHPHFPPWIQSFQLLSEPLFAYIVWIFLPFLTYPVAPPYLLSCGNEDIIFDPGISIYHSFMPDVSIQVSVSGTF